MREHTTCCAPQRRGALALPPPAPHLPPCPAPFWPHTQRRRSLAPQAPKTPPKRSLRVHCRAIMQGGACTPPAGEGHGPHVSDDSGHIEQMHTGHGGAGRVNEKRAGRGLTGAQTGMQGSHGTEGRGRYRGGSGLPVTRVSTNSRGGARAGNKAELEAKQTAWRHILARIRPSSSGMVQR